MSAVARRTRDLAYREMLPIGLAILAISMTSFFRVPLLPEIGRDLAFTASQLGLLTTSFALGRLAADIPTGRVAERFAPGRMLAAAACAMAAGSALFAVAGSLAVAVAASAVLGVASAVANTTGMLAFSGVPGERRGLAMAGFSSALLGGQALGPLVGGVLAELGSWRTALAAAAIVGALLVPLIASKAPAGANSSRLERAARGAAVAPPVPGVERVALYAVPFVMFFTLGAMPQTLVPLIGDSAYGLGAAVIGLALGVGGLCRFLGGLLGGLVSDRVSRRAALLPGLSLQAVGVALLAIGGVAWWFAAIIVMSLASFSISVAATILADQGQPGEVGGQLGTFRFVGDLGLVAGPVVTSMLYERVGADWAVAAVAGLLAACTLSSVALIRETHRGAIAVALGRHRN